MENLIHRHRSAIRLRRIRSVYAYVAASLIVTLCWYGWTFEILQYEGDLTHYGPAARLAGLLSMPVTRGLNFLPPPDPITTALLIWVFWFCITRLLIASWNLVGRTLAGKKQGLVTGPWKT